MTEQMILQEINSKQSRIDSLQYSIRERSTFSDDIRINANKVAARAEEFAASRQRLLKRYEEMESQSKLINVSRAFSKNMLGFFSGVDVQAAYQSYQTIVDELYIEKRKVDQHIEQMQAEVLRLKREIENLNIQLSALRRQKMLEEQQRLSTQ